MDVLEEKHITASEAKKILLSRSKEEELGYEQKNALDHLRKSAKLKDKEIKEMYEELDKVGRLKEKQIVMIMDSMPQDVEELRMTFANEALTLSEDQKKQILGIVKKHT